VKIKKPTTRKSKVVAAPIGWRERLVAAGLVRSKARPISELKIERIGADSALAVRAILEDREED
jgi:hypothetical protein